MQKYAQLGETLARITAAASSASLWAIVKDYVAQFGFTHVVAIDAARIVGGVRDAVLFSDALPELLRAIDAEGAYEDYPLVKRGLETEFPFLVSELTGAPEHKGAPWTEKLLAEVVKRGEGLVIPVWRNREPLGGFNLGGDNPDLSGLARALLQVVCHAALERALELRQGKGSSAGTALSVRETQCLRHVAIGQSDADIGKLLGISPRTVRFHVDSAKAKLGVSTRVQAIAKALRERIIAV
ncbi:MAG: autoinducer binding domain-containing protein [Alphaproteobacteria bacterium]|nr:autoinducer binding domain-containing protein [Alphaproteobacteria bacterium]